MKKVFKKGALKHVNFCAKHAVMRASEQIVLAFSIWSQRLIKLNSFEHLI